MAGAQGHRREVRLRPSASGHRAQRSDQAHRPRVWLPVRRVLPGGALGWVTCQQAGSLVGSTRVWDKLRDGSWVSDNSLATPGKPGFTSTVPPCTG
jgi:hypothetical protein